VPIRGRTRACSQQLWLNWELGESLRQQSRQSIGPRPRGVEFGYSLHRPLQIQPNRLRLRHPPHPFPCSDPQIRPRRRRPPRLLGHRPRLRHHRLRNLQCQILDQILCAADPSQTHMPQSARLPIEKERRSQMRSRRLVRMLLRPAQKAPQRRLWQTLWRQIPNRRQNLKQADSTTRSPPRGPDPIQDHRHWHHLRSVATCGPWTEAAANPWPQFQREPKSESPIRAVPERCAGRRCRCLPRLQMRQSMAASTRPAFALARRSLRGLQAAAPTWVAAAAATRVPPRCQHATQVALNLPLEKDSSKCTRAAMAGPQSRPQMPGHQNLRQRGNRPLRHC
jgi:hypothetical protein